MKMMDKKKLYSPSTSDVDDAVKLKNSSKNDYGTSPYEQKTADQKREPTELLSCRRILYTMMFLGFVVAYCLRASLSEAIVAMVNQTTVIEDTMIANTTSQCPRDPQQLPVNGNGQFTWDRHQQGIVLAAFYYGYILTQVRRLYDLKISRFTVIYTALHFIHAQ